MPPRRALRGGPAGLLRDAAAGACYYYLLTYRCYYYLLTYYSSRRCLLTITITITITTTFAIISIIPITIIE